MSAPRRTPDFAALVRPTVHVLPPCVHGAPGAGARGGRLVELGANENFLGASPKALAEYRRAAREVHRYPDCGSMLLREGFARAHGLEASEVVVGSGSDEVLRMLCSALLSPEDEVVVSQHSFVRFKQHSALMGAKVIEVPMSDWTHDLDTMARAASSRTKLVFVANPNNPTGTYNTSEEVSALLRRLPPGCVLVLDEAYAEYAESCPDYPRSLPGLVRRHPNLFVVRSFSKVYGLAGLRVGVGVGDPSLVGWLDRVRLAFNVTLPAQRAALAALADRAFVRRSAAAALREREALGADLRRLGCTTIDSAANFLFVGVPVPGRELSRRLLRRGVSVRPLDEYGLPDHVRISVGSAEDRRRLCAALARALSGEDRDHG